MEIPIQYPWYRRSFPSRFSNLTLEEPIIDLPLVSPISLSFPWMKPLFMRWFNWSENGYSEMRMEKDRLVIYLDVKHFSPDDLSVSVSDEFITVHAQHEDRQDDQGFVSREFLRKYRLPSGVLGADITSNLSSDGVLTITAPRSSPGPDRNIPISFEDGTQKQKM